MQCPACKSQLVVVEREGIELDWCVSCRGLWFDEGELELLGETVGRRLDVADLGRRATAVSKGSRRCPRCRRRMEALELPVELHGEPPVEPPGPGEASLVIDRCRLHGFWLDRGELGTLLDRMGTRRKTDEDLVLDFLGETFRGTAPTSNGPAENGPAPNERRDE